MTSAQFPDKLQCLFLPKRFKVLWGGRGAGRSWGVARWLLIQGVSRPIRVLCARELQNSISESVHKVLSDQIDQLGFINFYDIGKAQITGANGTTFNFEGIKKNTNKIKSYEGIDYCWVEEANNVSKTSWNILIPTIRREDSEVIITFNPELDTDYTYQRFVKSPSEDSIVVKMTYEDNPWFPEVLRKEMEDCRERDPDEFLNVWEGYTRQSLDGAVYAKELRRAQEEGRICSIPWEREYPVHTFWDLGHSDATAIWFGQRVAMQYRFIDYVSASGLYVQDFLKMLQEKEYLYGGMYLPHDAKAKVFGTKRSVEEQVRAAHPGRTFIVPKLLVADGINAVRTIFPNCWFDEDNCADGLQALRHYQYKVASSPITLASGTTRAQFSKDPLHNWASNGADAFRYAALSFKTPQTRNETSIFANLGRTVEQRLGKRQREQPEGLGWMG